MVLVWLQSGSGVVQSVNVQTWRNQPASEAVLQENRKNLSHST